MATQNQPASTFVQRAPTIAEIADFLKTRTRAEMAEILKSVHESSPQGAFMAAFVTPPAVAPAISDVADKAVTPIKPKKALNSFVGFRTYYITVPQFKSFPMKKISNMLAAMWNEDTNKPIWIMLAKTWSEIRDQIGKDKAPLVPYFSLMCPAMMLPTPEQYLELFRWEVYLDDQNDPRVRRLSDPPTLSTSKVRSTMSTSDIVRYCRAHGYATEFKLDDDHATSSTFHVPLKQGPKTSDQIINNMEAKRIAKREKKLLQRAKKINQGAPANLQLRLAQLRGIEASPGTSALSSPELAPMPMPSTTMTDQQTGNDDLNIVQLVNAFPAIAAQMAPSQNFLAAPGTTSIQNTAAMDDSNLAAEFAAMTDVSQVGDTVSLSDISLAQDVAPLQDITATFNSSTDNILGSSLESITDVPNNDSRTMGWDFNTISDWQGDSTFTLDNQFDNSLFGGNTMAFGELDLAFRDGADGDATLPDLFDFQF